MQGAGWQGARLGAETPQVGRARRPAAATTRTTTPPTRPRMPSFTQRVHQRGPQALIEIFRDYPGPIPDDVGEIRNLSVSQAALIRSCGYPARAGRKRASD